MSLLVALACSTLSLPLDESLSRPGSFADFLTRDTTYYMLRGLVPAPNSAVTDLGDAWTVDCGSLPPDLKDSLAATVTTVDGTLDPRLVRKVFEEAYFGTTAARGEADVILPTLAEFEAKAPFKSWPSEIVEFSAVKRKSRRIFRSPEGAFRRISVAETLETETGDQAAPVRETEVALLREDGRDWDFYAYDSSGALSPVSTFPAGERPSPRICIACHYDSGTRSVSRFFP